MSMEYLYTLVSMHNPIFTTYAFWSSVLVIKMMLLTLLTTLQRFRYKVFPNEEDLVLCRKATEVRFDEPHVERVRRAHRNDLENILPYLIIGLIYVVADPKKSTAILLFRIGAIARILHTLVYAFRPIPQPIRAFIFFVHYFVCLFMVGHVLIFTARYI